MNGSVFLDTNVLVYANDAGEPAKQHAARTLLKDVLHADIGAVPPHDRS